MIEPRVVFLDGHVAVVDKPAGMPSVPARNRHDPESVVTRLASHLGGIEAVHRLDRDTSGLLVLARTPTARATLGRAFEARHVRKLYVAAVVGRLPGARGILHMPLAADPLGPPRQRVDPVLGRRAETRWLKIAECDDAGRRLALVALEPITGRSHQLRAHLAWLGTPIVGDRLYGGDAAPGLALHAVRIEFPHPHDGRLIALVAPPEPAGPWSPCAAALQAQDWDAVGASAAAPTCDQ